MSASAQGVKIYLKGFGSPIDYPASQIEKIEFYPASTTPAGPDDPNQPGGTTVTEDKQFLEDTGVQFLNQVKASDFRKITKSVAQLDDYDGDAVEDWVEAALNAAKTALGGSYTEENSYGRVYQYTDYKCLLRASSFTGHFVVNNNQWVKERDADDLQFTFTDPNGQVCVARAFSSGTTKTVHVVNDDDSQGYVGSMKLYDRNKYYLEVPSHVEATYTIGGTEMVHVSVDVDLSSLTEEWDLSTQGASVFVTVTIAKESGGQYVMTVNRAGYQPVTGAFVDFLMTNDGQPILKASVSSAGTVNVNSVNVNDEPEIHADDLGTAVAHVDVLGRVQFDGTINSVGNFIKYLSDADEYDDNGNEHRRLVARANNELNAQFFYNNTTDSRGTLSLESFEEDSWGGKYYYAVRPIITFKADGSSYALDTYFSEDAFQTVVDTYKNLLDDFNDLIEGSRR